MQLFSSKCGKSLAFAVFRLLICLVQTSSQLKVLGQSRQVMDPGQKFLLRLPDTFRGVSRLSDLACPV